MSNQSGKVLLGLILLIVGAMLLLDLFGIDTGDLLGYLIPGAMMLYGGKKVVWGQSTGGKAWGTVLFLIGLLLLVGKMELLFSCLLAIGAIYFGYRLIRKQPKHPQTAHTLLEQRWAQAVLKEDEFERQHREFQK